MRSTVLEIEHTRLKAHPPAEILAQVVCWYYVRVEY